MKVREDFVTNSSSSSFVGITINLKDGRDVEIDIEETGEWNEYYLPNSINGIPLRGIVSECGSVFAFSYPFREDVSLGYKENDITTLPQLALCLLECTNSEYETEFPPDLFLLLFSVYIDQSKAEELYVKMNERTDWMKREYEEYNEEFFDWIKEDVIGYRADSIITAVKDIESINDIRGIHVFRKDHVRDSEMYFAHENNPDDWDFIDDHHATRELEYDYDVDSDADSTSDAYDFTIKEEKSKKPGQTVHLDFQDKVFVTTGLSEEEKAWVSKQIESRGGILKRKFVVSLNYLIYNPDYNHETVKLTRAKEQIEKGKDVQIITFEEFRNSL